jgi:hypothetical protein
MTQQCAASGFAVFQGWSRTKTAQRPKVVNIKLVGGSGLEAVEARGSSPNPVLASLYCVLADATLVDFTPARVAA